MSVKHVRDVPLLPVEAGEETAIQVLIPPDEGPSFAMRRNGDIAMPFFFALDIYRLRNLPARAPLTQLGSETDRRSSLSSSES